MSDNIETGTINGVQSAAFFSAREDAWHRLGTVTSDCLTAEDALRTAHLDWTVSKQPLTVPMRNAQGHLKALKVPDKFGIVRDANPFTGEPDVLSVVGKQYVPVQNADNADFLNTLVDESGAHFETAGSLNGGRQVFVSMKVPQTVEVGGVDPVDLYLVATNSHDGTSPFRVMVTPIRVVCQNTLRAALRSAKSTFSVRHTANATKRIEEARQTLGLTFKYVEAFEAEAAALYEQEYTDREFTALVENLLAEDKDASDRVKAERARKIEDMRFLFNEAPTQQNIAGTKWAAYNAITEYVDWGWPVKGDEDARAERIATATWTEKFKDEALAALRN